LKKHFLRLHSMQAILWFIAFGLMTQACNKRPEQIGSSIQPDKDLINLFYVDTLSIVAYSFLEDSVRTDEPERILLGSMKDPVFGTTVAGFYSQVRLSTSTHDFGANPMLDSLVLQLAYAGYYGDTTTQQTIRVHELQDDIFLDSAYYSTSVKNYSVTDFASYTYNPRPKTRFPWEGDTLSPLIRMRLSDISPDLGNKLLSATTDDLSTNEKFVAFFKGLFITVDQVNHGGAIVYYNLPVNLSRMTIYYNNDEQDSLRYEFFISGSEARFNYFDHLGYQDADPEFKSQVIDGDTTLGNNILYLQSMGGVKSRLRFPGLVQLRDQVDGKLVVNEAKIIFSGLSIDTMLYFVPPQLAIVKSNGDGTYSILSDQLEGDTYYGGTYLSSRNEYQFRLTRYVQDMILKGEDKVDHGLFVSIIGASARANRWIYNGIQPENDTLKPLRLLINYSVVKD